MIRLRLALELDYDITEPACDFIFNIHAAHTERQQVVEEWLHLSQDVQLRVETEPTTRNRYLRVKALPGPLKLAYSATALSHHIAEPGQIGEVPVARLPAQVLSYIYPSRYCQSDRLHRLAMREFGQQWQGYSRVQAIRDWVRCAQCVAKTGLDLDLSDNGGKHRNEIRGFHPSAAVLPHGLTGMRCRRQGRPHAPLRQE